MLPSTNPASLAMDALTSEIRHLAGLDNITPSQNQRLESLMAEHESRTSARSARMANIRSATTERHVGYDPIVMRSKTSAEVFQVDARNRGEVADLALRAIESVQRSSGVELVPEVEQLARRGDGFAELLRAQASPDYLTAWGKLVTSGDPARAMFVMTDAERSAFGRVAEARAMSGAVDTAGGFGLPVLVDPALQLTNDGTVNPVRRIARVVRGVGREYRILTSAGSTASWDGEGTEVSDDAPVIGADAVTAYTGRVFIPVSDELTDDWPSLAEQLRGVLVDARNRLEATAFISGNGTTAPEGLITALDANTNVEVAVSTAGTLSASDFYNIFGQLPPRFRSNATWLANLDVINEIRQIGSEQLNTQTVSMTGDYSFRLLGRPVEEASDMPAWTGTTAAANVCIVGDFAQGYTVFDRLGASTVEVIPHLFGTNGRVTGQRGFFHAWRVGGAVTNPSAFRLLTNT